MKMGTNLLISEAAREVHVESHVLRYWEEELHLPIRRNEQGHRCYTQEDLERFRQIKAMKERGLQLKAIKMILRDGKIDVISGEENRDEAQVKTLPPALADTAGSARGSAAADSAEVSQEEPAAFGGERALKEGPAEKLPIEIVAERNLPDPGNRLDSKESRGERARRLQWLLQQLIRETLRENNKELCREMKESIVKELDYQFRSQEEREEERDKLFHQRNEEYYKKMDEMLRAKNRIREGRDKKDRRAAKREEKENRKRQREVKRQGSDSAEQNEKPVPKGKEIPDGGTAQNEKPIQDRKADEKTALNEKTGQDDKKVQASGRRERKKTFLF